MGWRDFGRLCASMNIKSIFERDTTSEVEHGALSIKSHGATVAKNHARDWLVLLLLVLIEVILSFIHPFRHFVGKDMMADLKYPMKENTVPVWAVPMYAVLLPITIFNLFYIFRRDVHDLHHSILGLLYAVLVTGVLTDAIKVASGRPRPDFFWRCFPDGIEAYDVLGNVNCHGKDREIKVGYKSFPSGHTSWSFAGLGFLSLYLSGKIQPFDHKGHAAKSCIVFIPLLAASLVAISRVDDYRHHWQDVFAGGLLGLVVASCYYLQFFPPPHNENGWAPYAYFQCVEKLHANTNTVHQATAVSTQSTEVEVANQQARQDYKGSRSLHMDHDSSLQLDEMESGRR